MNSITPLEWLAGGIAFFLMGVAGSAAGADEGVTAPGWIPGTSAWITVSDCVKVVRNEATGTVWVDRVFDNARGYRWDAPGARIRFRTDSAEVAVHLMYSARHIGPARNSIGFYRIDGRGNEVWRFTRPPVTTLPGDASLILKLPVPATAGFHDYELILPYGDALELRGVAVTATARWEAPAARPAVRWVAFGDSVTHGFTSSAVLHSYPLIVGEAKDWEVINAGIGGRAAMAADGVLLAGIDADLYSIAIGVNDWQGGTELEVFRKNMNGLLKTLLAGRPDARIFVVTPLWVAPTWKPEKTKYPLSNYRMVISQVVAALAEKRLVLIDGPSLIDHDAAFFDPVSVHPNDAGFAQMAERLTEALEK